MSKTAFQLLIAAACGPMAAGLGTAAWGQDLRFEPEPLRLETLRDDSGEAAEEQLDLLPLTEAEAVDRVATTPNPGKATVHLASYLRAADAEAGWHILSERFPNLLSRHEPILRDIELAGRGAFVRLLAGPLASAEEAKALCAELKAEGAYCLPADLTGSFLLQTWD